MTPSASAVAAGRHTSWLLVRPCRPAGDSLVLAGGAGLQEPLGGGGGAAIEDGAYRAAIDGGAYSTSVAGGAGLGGGGGGGGSGGPVMVEAGWWWWRRAGRLVVESGQGHVWKVVGKM